MVTNIIWGIAGLLFILGSAPLLMSHDKAYLYPFSEVVNPRIMGLCMIVWVILLAWCAHLRKINFRSVPSTYVKARRKLAHSLETIFHLHPEDKGRQGHLFTFESFKERLIALALAEQRLSAVWPATCVKASTGEISVADVWRAAEEILQAQRAFAQAWDEQEKAFDLFPTMNKAACFTAAQLLLEKLQIPKA